MITTTRWSPDTCDCVLEYEWDTDSPEDTRVHTFKNIERKCDSHAGLNQDHAHYDHVVKENQTKNKMIQKIMDHVPRLKKQRQDERGNTVQELDPSVEYRWSLTGKDHQRQLQVELKGVTLTKKEKDDLKAGASSLDKPVNIL
jgi:hypothetical protein